jgi:hypothetical protein
MTRIPRMSSIVWRVREVMNARYHQV